MNTPTRPARTRSIAVAALAPLLLAAAALTSCTGSAGAVKRPDYPIPPGALSVQGEPGTLGGTLTVALPSDVMTFNPFVQSDLATLDVCHQLYAPLVGFDPVTREVVPQGGLADSYQAEGNRVTIRLRPGLTFSDGTPIRADDVVYSLRVATDREVRSPLADMLTVSGRLPQVTKADDTTVVLEFVESYPAIGYVLSQLPIVSAGKFPSEAMNAGHFADAMSTKSDLRAIVSSGPFTIGKYEKGSSLTLDFNPYYWKVDSSGRRLPYVDHLVYRFGLADADVADGLRKKTIQLAPYLSASAVAALGAGDGFETKDLGVGYGTWMLVCNMRADKDLIDLFTVTHLQRKEFREFLSYSVDRERIAKEVFGGKATPAFGPVSPADTVWYSDAIKKRAFDPAAAKAALESGKVPVGGAQVAYFTLGDDNGKPQLYDPGKRPVRFNLYYPKTEVAEAIQKIVVAELASQGVGIRPVPVDPSQFLSQRLLKGAFDIALTRVDGLGSDPISYMPVFMSNGAKHYYLDIPPGTEDPLAFEPDVNRLMRSLQDRTLVDDRKKDFAKAQQVWADNVPVVYLVADNVQVAAATNLGNFKPVAVQPSATWNAEMLFLK